jgi:hypothetical protein
MSHLVTNVPRNIKRAYKHLAPIIEERYAMMTRFGESWEEKPNDFLQWMMEDEGGKGKPVHEHVQHILAMNFAAIHTSSTVRVCQILKTVLLIRLFDDFVYS